LSWDLFCKALIKECAQDFITYFAPGARYVGMRECQVQTRMDGPFDPREMRGDTVPEAERAGKRFLLNTECQSSKDEKMDERLLGYSYELTRLHGLSVRSAVIYTQPVEDVPQSPLIRSIPCNPLPDGNVAIQFHYASLDACNGLVEEFWELDLDAFSVLALLCKDGGTSAVLEAVLERLLRHKHERKESISTALFFAGKVFKSEEDLKFLERKREMLKDSLRESWTYQKVLSEGFEEGIVEGREKGIEEGREKGRVEEARANIVLFVEKRFPIMLSWVQEQVAQVSDLKTLQEVLPALFMANDAEEIRIAFSSLH